MSKGGICAVEDIDSTTMWGNENDKPDCFIDFSKDDVSQDMHHNPYNQVDTFLALTKV